MTHIKKRFAARILPRTTPYSPAVDTDIRRTFARVLKQQQEDECQPPPAVDAPEQNAAIAASALLSSSQDADHQVVQLRLPLPIARRQRGAITVDDLVAMAAALCLWLAYIAGAFAS